MKRILWQTALMCILAALAWFNSGCDKANDPDLPAQPYHLVRAIPLDGLPEDVCARGDYIAVSNGEYGALVFDTQRMDSIFQIFRYDQRTSQSRCSNVAIDPQHTLLAPFVYRADVWVNGIFDWSKDILHDTVNVLPSAGGPLAGYDIQAKLDTIIFWTTDTYPANDWGIVRTAWKKSADLIHWERFGINCQFQPGKGMSRNFERRDDDKFAVANDEAGIYIFDPTSCDSLCSVNTPGIAYDCAWFGNYVAVADQYSLIIVDATDLNHASVISALTLSSGGSSTAHRLREVAVDGHYACVADDFDGVYIVDISNPRAPVSVQLIRMHDVTAVSTDHGVLCIADKNEGLVIFQR